MLAIISWIYPAQSARGMEFEIDPSLNTPQVIYQPYPSEFKTKPKPRAERVVQSKGYDPCSCVSYSRWKSGIYTGRIGVARRHPINATKPTVGAIVVTNESRAGHVGVVISVEGETFTITEANYSRCRVGTRTLSINSKVIKGFYVSRGTTSGQ